jgi:hypothetical protein
VYQSDDDLDLLLAGGHLSGAQYDSVEERVMSSVAPRPRRLLRWLPLAAAACCVLGASTLVVNEKDSGFRSKGSAMSQGLIALGCGREVSRVCRPDSTLMFTVNAAVVSGHFGGYATPVGMPSSARIWYFPNASGEAPFVSSGTGTVVLPNGIRIGPEHQSGRYQVTVWLSSRPLSRKEVDQASPDVFLSRESLEIEVVR